METKTIQCNKCHREIKLGDDVIVVEKCVIGPRGIIPLGEKNVFCCEECLEFYFSGNSSQVPRRIP